MINNCCRHDKQAFDLLDSNNDQLFIQLSDKLLMES